MNKQNDDKYFTQLFNVKYSEDYKKQLKDKLLDKYSEKNKKKLNKYYSLIAACLIVFATLFIINNYFNISDNSYSSKTTSNYVLDKKLSINSENIENKNSNIIKNNQSLEATNKPANKTVDKKEKQVNNFDENNKRVNINKKNKIENNSKLKTKNTLIAKDNTITMKKNVEKNHKVNNNIKQKDDLSKKVGNKNKDNDAKNLEKESKENTEINNMAIFTLRTTNQVYNEDDKNQTVCETTYNEIYSTIIEETYNIDFINDIKNIFNVEINDTVYSSVYEQVYLEVYGYRITDTNSMIKIDRISNDNNLIIDCEKAEEILKRLVPYEYKLVEKNGSFDIVEYYDNIIIERDYGFLRFNNNILQNAEIKIHRYISRENSNKINIADIERYLISEYNITSYNRANLNFMYRKINHQFILSVNYKDDVNNYFIENMESKIIK